MLVIWVIDNFINNKPLKEMYRTVLQGYETVLIDSREIEKVLNGLKSELGIPRPDVVIVEPHVSVGRSGYELLDVKRILDALEEEGCKPYVVVCSTQDKSTLKENGIDLTCYLRKPFNPDELRRILQQFSYLG